ncbi:MAG TPA: hypothetical protein VGC89_22780 [Pyrinomonadaceae bacterium]
MASLEIYRDRFAESGWEIFERAFFTGRVEAVNEHNSTLRIMVFIFGREQPVELTCFDVDKLKTE